MPKFYVSIPIAGSSTYEVEAENGKAAIKAAWAKVEAGEEGDITWEFFDEITSGNVLHAPLNEVEVSRAHDETTQVKGEEP